MQKVVLKFTRDLVTFRFINLFSIYMDSVRVPGVITTVDKGLFLPACYYFPLGNTFANLKMTSTQLR